ncbi:MAG: GAF domain-containing protein [Anaerolineae bacterium]|nr:GAF domain-containing protein [Anaerolineae bacterium]
MERSSVSELATGRYAGTLAVDADGAVLSASPALAALLDDPEQGWRGAHFCSWLADTAQEDARAAWEAFQARGAPNQIEAPLRNGPMVQLVFEPTTPPDAWTVVVHPAPGALERRIAELETLAAAGRALASTLDLPTILDLTFQHLRAVLPFDSAALLLYGRDGFRVARAEGYPEEYPEQVQGRLERFPTFARLFRERRPLLVRDTAQSEAWQAARGSEHIRAWIGVPLIARDEVLGVLSIDSQTAGAYTAYDADLAFSFGQEVAVALYNARRYEQALTRANHVGALYQIGLAISHTDVDKVLRLVHRQLSELMDVSTFYIALYDTETDSVHFRLSFDRGAPLEPFTVKAAGTLVGWVIAHQQTVVIVDTERQEPPVPLSVRGSPMRSLLLVPLSAGDQIVGVLSVQSETPDAFSDDDALLVEAIASQTAVVIRNAQLFDETEHRLAALEALQQTSLSLTSAPDPVVALEGIAQNVMDLLQPCGLCICMVDEAGLPQDRYYADPTATARVQAPEGMAGRCLGNMRLELLSVVTQEVTRTGAPLLVTDAPDHPLFRRR